MPGATEKRADVVLLINGISLVVIEAKTLVRSSQSWLDAAIQVHDQEKRHPPRVLAIWQSQNIVRNFESNTDSRHPGHVNARWTQMDSAIVFGEPTA